LVISAVLNCDICSLFINKLRHFGRFPPILAKSLSTGKLANFEAGKNY